MNSWLYHVRSSSLNRNRTQASCLGSRESWPLDHQGSPGPDHFLSFVISLDLTFLLSVHFPGCIAFAHVGWGFYSEPWDCAYRKMASTGLVIPQFEATCSSLTQVLARTLEFSIGVRVYQGVNLKAEVDMGRISTFLAPLRILWHWYFNSGLQYGLFTVSSTLFQVLSLTDPTFCL